MRLPILLATFLACFAGFLSQATADTGGKAVPDKPKLKSLGEIQGQVLTVASDGMSLTLRMYANVPVLSGAGGCSH